MTISGNKLFSYQLFSTLVINCYFVEKVDVKGDSGMFLFSFVEKEDDWRQRGIYFYRVWT